MSSAWTIALCSDVSFFELQQHSKIHIPVPTCLVINKPLGSMVCGNTHTLRESATMVCNTFLINWEDSLTLPRIHSYTGCVSLMYCSSSWKHHLHLKLEYHKQPSSVMVAAFCVVCPFSKFLFFIYSFISSWKLKTV